MGNIARQHIDNLLSEQVPGAVLAAVCSRDADALDAAWNVPHFTDQAQLLAADVCDAVLIATPSYAHLPMGVQALRAGVHVMMEKPMGLSVAEAEQLLAEQGEDQVFALMLNQRCDPLFERMRDEILAGTLGEITRVQWTMTHWFRPEIYFQVSDWRATWRGEGGGLLLNQCIHNLDILQWLCGLPAQVRGHCQFGRYHDIEVEDEATAWFEFANGASGTFVGSTGEAPGHNCLDVVGDRGSLRFDGTSLQLTRNQPGTRQFSETTSDMFGMPVSQSEDITPVRDVNQHARILTNFAAAVRGDETLIAPAADGVACLQLANGILLSSWQQQTLSLPLDSRAYQAALDKKIAASTLRTPSDRKARIDMNQSYR